MLRPLDPEINTTRSHHVLILLVILFVSSCIPHPASSSNTLRQVEPSRLPDFHDDLDRPSLLQAAKRQREYLQKMSDVKGISIGGHLYSPNQLLDSINDFIQIFSITDPASDTNRFMMENYDAYQAPGIRNGNDFGQMLVTGYYEPIFDGSLHPTPPFLFPLYAKPPDLQSRKTTGSEKLHTGRSTNGKFSPYWTRTEIESGNILAGNELVFLKDPFEAFLLHVQGSGKIRFPDGSMRSICYTASNGHPYRSIGKLLVDEKKLSLAEVTLPAIEGYLRDHPGEMTRILRYNPRYIFFRWGDNLGPRGSSNIPLTPGRSVAIDQQALPAGTIGYLVSRRPLFDSSGGLVGWIPVRRFVFPQDSGAAIQGPGRVDLYLGDSKEARLSAGLMKEEGTLYFLLKKQPIPLQK